MFKDTQFSPKEIWDNLLIKMLEYLSGGLMDKVLVQRSKMLSGILLIKLRPLLNSTRMLLISQESHPTTVKMLLHLTNISHLSKWVSHRCKVHHLLTLGDHQFTRLENKVNKSKSQSSNGIPMETETVLRKRISLKILQDKPRLQSNSIKIPLISQGFMPVINTRLHQALNISTVIRLVPLFIELLLLKLMAHQHQKVNTSGENQSIQPEEWDNLSQTFNLKKELEPLSSSNGQMETDLVQRSMISSMILLGTLEVMKPNSIKTLLTSQVLLLTLDTIPPQSMNGVLEDLKPLETEICIDYKS